MSNPSDTTTAALPVPLSTPSLDVTGRIFLITGGTQGLGLEIATQLKRNGAAAIVLVSRSPDKLQSALEQLNGDGGNHESTSQQPQCIIQFVKSDLSNAADTSSIVPRAIKLLSQESSLPQPPVISGIVNAAATTSRGNLLTTTADMFDGQFATNVRGPFLVTQSAAKHMMEQHVPRGVGSIVNICSVAAKGGAPFIMAYSCAKSALVTLTKNNAAELAPRGIRVNGVNMGWCLTENEHKLQREVHKDDEWWKKADGSVPLGRILRPADVAATVLFLLSGASVMMTGSILGEWCYSQFCL